MMWYSPPCIPQGPAHGGCSINVCDTDLLPEEDSIPPNALKITPAVIELNLSSDSETTCGLFCIMPDTDENHIVLVFKELSPL